ncbi:hypothetical protein AC578_1139 [Pseudocercospora eumusae]|uniref:Uncharacterized protein n=1 Tax=Pseudocercospora eumusae TaxID=321146 RepID=A0A139HJR9_9PEZI|nr:hypothetical protein AC578_1139 [Pseudocercospora eumusae]
MAAAQKTPESRPLATGLFPCRSCSGYHYIEDCIYTLTWTEWLEYQALHMPSQLAQISGLAGTPEHQIKAEWLVQRAQDLDELAEVSRPNFLANTRLKADLMTKSSTDMYWDDEMWKKKLGLHTSYQMRKRQLLAGARGESSASTGHEAWHGGRNVLPLMKRLEASEASSSADPGHAANDVDDSSEDELSLSRLRAEFGPRLPRTSKATLLKS